jgi:hypothetical protein
LLNVIEVLCNSFYSILNNHHLSLLFQALEASYSFSFAANNNTEVWKATGKSGLFFSQFSHFPPYQ